jgi:hypothetical protein
MRLSRTLIAAPLLAGIALVAPRPRVLAGPKTYIIKPGQSGVTRAGYEYFFKRRRHRRVKLVELKAGDGYVISNPRRAWGTRLTIYHLTRLMAIYRKRFPDAPPLIVLDISKRGGGRITGHTSHQEGRDVDLPLVLNRMQDIAHPEQRTINVPRTWFLLKTLADTCDVEFMFLDSKIQKMLRAHALQRGLSRQKLDLLFQYPDRGRLKGLVVHWPGHLDHIHVRFRYEGTPLPKHAKLYCDKVSAR